MRTFGCCLRTTHVVSFTDLHSAGPADPRVAATFSRWPRGPESKGPGRHGLLVADSQKRAKRM